MPNDGTKWRRAAPWGSAAMRSRTSGSNTDEESDGRMDLKEKIEQEERLLRWMMPMLPVHMHLHHWDDDRRGSSSLPRAAMMMTESSSLFGEAHSSGGFILEFFFLLLLRFLF